MAITFNTNKILSVAPKQNNPDLIAKAMQQPKLPQVNSYGGALKSQYDKYSVPQVSSAPKNPNTANIATGVVPQVNSSGGNSYIAAAMNKQIGNTNNYSGSNSYGGNGIGVRNSLINAGFDGSKIGWDGQNVTYGGVPIVKPDYIGSDDRSYSNTQNIISGMNKAFGGRDEMLDVTGAATGQGLSNLVEYGADGSVTIGGQPISNVVIMNGQAYAPRSAINAAMASFRQNSGYRNEGDVYDDYSKKNSQKAESLANKLGNYKSFKYDPADDIAYKVYQEQYRKNADEAFRDTYGRLANRMGGYANSAAMAVASQAYAKEMNKMNEVIPSLVNDAYGRYSDDYSRLDNYTQNYYGTPKSNLNTELDAYSRKADRIERATQANEERNRYNNEWNYIKQQYDLNIEQARQQIEANNALAPYQKEEAILKLQDAYYDLEQKIKYGEIKTQTELERSLAEIDYIRSQAGVNTSNANYTNVKASLEPSKVQSQIAVDNSTVTKNNAAAQKSLTSSSGTNYFLDALKSAESGYTPAPTGQQLLNNNNIISNWNWDKSKK